MTIMKMKLSEFKNTIPNLYHLPDDYITTAEGWDKVRKEFLTDKNENLKVLDLLDQLKKHGSFRNPIAVTYITPPELNRNPEISEPTFVVENGTHRSIAYMLLSEELNDPDIEIEYLLLDDNESQVSEDEFDYYETSVVFKNALTDNQIYGFSDFLLISKPVSNGEWLEMITISFVGGKFILFWGNPKANQFPTEEVENLILDTLILNGISKEEVTISTAADS